jgi:hypothetical protein
MKDKHETCAYAKETGNLAVYVTTGCPNATMIKGVLVSSRERCRKCKSWKEKRK